MPKMVIKSAGSYFITIGKKWCSRLWIGEFGIQRVRVRKRTKVKC
jgi:hypothetical protein